MLLKIIFNSVFCDLPPHSDATDADAMMAPLQDADSHTAEGLVVARICHAIFADGPLRKRLTG